METWKKNLETLELAGDDRTAGSRKLELSECMELRETKRLALTGRVANQRPNRGHVCVVLEPRGNDDECKTNAESKARNIANARNSDRTF